MDFFEHQDRARRKTGLLVFLFALAVIAIVTALYLVSRVLIFADAARTPGSHQIVWWDPADFALASECFDGPVVNRETEHGKFEQYIQPPFCF